MVFHARQMTIPGLIALLVAGPLAVSQSVAQVESRVEGTVVDGAGEPISGVTVSLEAAPDGDVEATALSDEGGTFRLAVPDPSRSYRLELSKEGYRPLVQELSPVRGGVTSVEAVMVPLPDERGRSGGAAGNPLLQGAEALKAGDLEEALEKLRTAAELNPDVAVAHSLLSLAELDAGDHAAAAAAAERALELDPSDARALYVRYQAYRDLGDDERAAQALADLKGSDDPTAAAQRIFNQGAEAFGAGDLATAKMRFLVASEIDPELPNSYAGLGEIYRQERDYEKSLAMADRLLELSPEDPIGLRLRLMALFGLGRTDELREAAERLAAADPEWTTAQLPKLAQVAFEQNMMAEAAVLYETIVALDSDATTAYYNLGMSYYNQGETELARKALERFLEVAPDHPDAEAARSILEYME